MSKATLHNWDNIENEQLNPLLSRKFVTGEQSMFARVVLAEGCVVPRHSHPNEQITFITEGALRFIPGNLPHSATAEEDCIDFDVFTPPRQDWINKDDAYLRK